MMTKTKLLGAAAVLLLSLGAAAAAPAVSRQDLNVRSGPGTEYGVVGVIRAGETVDVGGCQGSWCQVAFDGSGYASRSYLQMAGAPSTGVVVQAPIYDPYDYEDDYGYSYGPGVSFYAGPRFRHRHDGWRHGWHGGRDGWRGDRNAGNWRGGDRTGPSWRGGDRTGQRTGSDMGRGAPQPGNIDRGGGGGRVSAPVGMPTAPAASAPAAAAPGGYAGGARGGTPDRGR